MKRNYSCTLEEYAEQHKSCHYCTRWWESSGICSITKRTILCPNRKRNCPIFDNVFEKNRIKETSECK